MPETQLADECKAEIARYLDALSSSLPAQIDTRKLSRERPPILATWARETLLWRFTELAQDALEKLNAKRFASAMLLTRAAVETTATLWHLNTQIRATITSRDIGKLEALLKHVVFGERVPGTPEELLALNVLTTLKHVEKTVPGTLRYYQELCEYSHPNYLGTTGLYSAPHKNTGVVELGSNIRGANSHNEICATALSATMRMFHPVYAAIGDSLPALVELCETSIPPNQK